MGPKCVLCGEPVSLLKGQCWLAEVGYRRSIPVHRECYRALVRAQQAGPLGAYFADQRIKELEAE